MRLFIAFHLPDSLLEKVEKTKADLKGQLRLRNARWAGPDQMHITLRFLGSLPETEVEPLREAIQISATQATPCQLELTGLGCFPNARRARVLWIGLRGDLTALGQLHQRLLDNTQAWGEVDSRPFHPHLTLARIKELRPNEGRELQAQVERSSEISLGEWTVKTIELMQSQLSPDGARYQSVASFPLGA